jgi:hypothetical protein
MKISLGMSLGILIVGARASTVGCSSATCQVPEVVSDTSSATYSYGGPGASTPSTGSVASLAVSGDSSTLTVTGIIGPASSFTITLPNLQGSGSQSLDPLSQVCLYTSDSNSGSCQTLSGTIATTSFADQCGSGGCALTIVGTLKGTAKWTAGSFSIDASLNHSETLESVSCAGGGE